MRLVPKSGASMTAVGDTLYVFGGQETVTGTCFNAVEVLDTVSWRWSVLDVAGGLPPARHSHVTGLLGSNCLLVHGGASSQGALADVWILNTDQKVWTRPEIVGASPPAREMHAAVMTDDTTLLIYGGRSNDGRVLCDAALFDCNTMSWTSVEPTPFAR